MGSKIIISFIVACILLGIMPLFILLVRIFFEMRETSGMIRRNRDEIDEMIRKF